MSEAQQPIDPDEAALAELAAKDLTAVRHVHAQLLAATDTDEINSLGRTYQRVARSLRQTLALKAKLKREAAQDAVNLPAQRRGPLANFDLEGHQLDARIEEIQGAVERVITAACKDEPEGQEPFYERFDREMDDWVLDERFLAETLDDQVRGICQALGLPEDLIARWRELPVPDYTPDPATRAPTAEAADPPVPWSNSG